MDVGSSAQRPTTLCKKVEDFPVESLKGSVALLRSKFGNCSNTDTSQIFGVSRPVSRSKTFHTVSRNNIQNQRNKPHLLTPEPRLGNSTSPHPASSCERANSKELIKNNQLRRQQFLEAQSIAPAGKDCKTPTTQSERSNAARNFLVNAIPTSPGSAHTATTQSLIQRPAPCEAVRSVISRVSAYSSSPHRVQSFATVESRSNQTFQVSESPVRETRASPLRETAAPSTGPASDIRRENNSTFTSSVTLSMADPALVEKYSHVTDMEQLNTILKNTSEFEERRAIRAAIRKLKDSNNNGGTTLVKGSDIPAYEVSSIDLSGYSTEEDLKILLHQTEKYEDKKRIRAAIRDLRKQSASQRENQSTPVKETTPTSTDRNKELSSQTPTTPQTPDTVSVLRDLSNETVAKPTTLSGLGTDGAPADVFQAAEEVVVSPIKHETRVLNRPSGDIQIETISKHSRTVSQSDVYEKSTKVTQISKVGGLEISEQDEIITKEKLSAKGSVSTESDVRRKVDIREPGGTRVVEEDVTVEKTHRSVTTGENSTTNLQVSIVREKRPPRVTKELTDFSGLDGEPLSLICEFETDGTNDDRKLEVTWMKDGTEIKPSADIKINWTAPVATLSIQELLYPDDCGQYTCKARNTTGSVESSSRVTVKEAAEKRCEIKFAEELSDLCVTDGDANVEVKCKLAGKIEDVEVSWYKNGKILKNNAEFKQKFDGVIATLIISEIFPEDSGEYECAAVKGNSESSSFCKLTLKESPPAPKHEISKPKLEDKNNNETIPDGKDVSEKEESEVSKCEEILKSASIDVDKTDSAADTPKSVDKATDKAQPKTAEKSNPFAKPGLKSVGKPAGVMNRPGAEQTVESLVGKLSRPGTAGSVSVSQSWKNNIGGNRAPVQTNATKTWGKTGAMSSLLGKGAPASARGAMAAFKQMDTANNPNGSAAPKPNSTPSSGVSINAIPAAKHAAKMIKRKALSVVEIKQELLAFCRANVQGYENVSIDNFSTSWNNGVAFLALIHHFYPDSFDWSKVDERRRRENFTLAFDIAEQKADIAPLLDVEDMVRMKKPDWKCVFTYVQSFYRKLRDHENNKHTYVQQ